MNGMIDKDEYLEPEQVWVYYCNLDVPRSKCVMKPFTMDCRKCHRPLKKYYGE